MAKRLLYLQFTDPAGYPPLEHSSAMLAERGWQVTLLGTDAFGEQKLKFREQSGVTVRNTSLSRFGIPLPLEYLLFLLRSLVWSWMWRPQWIYASDPLALPAIWLVRRFARLPVVYHEHDALQGDRKSLFMRLIVALRRSLAAEIEVCVLPQQQRLARFLEETKREGEVLCIWNTPRITEIQDHEHADRDGKLTLYYHGSINSLRLPRKLVVAAARLKGQVRIRIAGYEAAGSGRYVQSLIAFSAELGAPDLIEYLGTIAHRDDLLKSASGASVGLSLMPTGSSDLNLQHMAGASNKPFDYMACGLPLLVSDLPEWRSMFADSGYARACDPDDDVSIEAELRWFLEHPAERREMGRRGAEKIRTEWNYDLMFAPLWNWLDGKSCAS